jgi:hypothetical protein
MLLHGPPYFIAGAQANNLASFRKIAVTLTEGFAPNVRKVILQNEANLG